MFRETEQVFEQALELPVADRHRLADRLYESLPEAEFDDTWRVEIERRQAEWDAGLVEGFDLDDVLTEARARIVK